MKFQPVGTFRICHRGSPRYPDHDREADDPSDENWIQYRRQVNPSDGLKGFAQGGWLTVLEGLTTLEEKPELMTWYGIVGPGLQWETPTDFLIWSIIVGKKGVRLTLARNM